MVDKLPRPYKIAPLRFCPVGQGVVMGMGWSLLKKVPLEMAAELFRLSWLLLGLKVLFVGMGSQILTSAIEPLVPSAR